MHLGLMGKRRAVAVRGGGPFCDTRRHPRQLGSSTLRLPQPPTPPTLTPYNRYQKETTEQHIQHRRQQHHHQQMKASGPPVVQWGTVHPHCTSASQVNVIISSHKANTAYTTHTRTTRAAHSTQDIHTLTRTRITRHTLPSTHERSTTHTHDRRKQTKV